MTEPNPFLVYSLSGYETSAFRKCTLRVLVSDAELHAAVFDPLGNCFPRIERFSLQAGYSGLKNWQLAARIIQYAALFRQPFEQVEWIWNLQPYTMVPDTFYADENKSDYARFIAASPNNLVIQAQPVCRGSIQVVYGFPKEWKAVLEECALKPQLETHYTHWLLFYAELHLRQNNGVMVHFHDAFIDIVVYRNKALQLLNTFRYQTADECLYFILLACEQYRFDRATEALHLCGEIDSGSALFQNITKYFADVRFLNRTSEPATGEPLGEAPNMAQHYHMNLLHPAL
jgi:hypothetical protein